MVRHAEKAVNPDPREPQVPDDISAEMFVVNQNEQNKIDPPLTKLGMAQAARLGKWLKKYIETDLKLDMTAIKIQIVTSPFLRCLMTASIVA